MKSEDIKKAMAGRGARICPILAAGALVAHRDYSRVAETSLCLRDACVMWTGACCGLLDQTQALASLASQLTTNMAFPHQGTEPAASEIPLAPPTPGVLRKLWNALNKPL